MPNSLSKIRIKRNFSELPENENTYHESYTTDWSHYFRDDSEWSDVLESPRVLLVSEAGMGKTFECQEEQQSLWKAGVPSFYFELAALAQCQNLEDLLTPEEQIRLDHWKSSQFEVATFFLDSIDELKLTRRKFRTALIKFQNALKGQLGRIKVVITSRPIDIDLPLIQQYLPFPEQNLPPPDEAFAVQVLRRGQNQANSKSAPVWRKVTLQPLTEQQIIEFVENQGITESKIFVQELQQYNALEFARRPSDLLEMCAGWRPHQPITAYRQQVERNIHIKLTSHRDDEKVELSADLAMQGASRLALACLLTRKLTIRYSITPKPGNSATSLNPAALLTGWHSDQIKTLLERALFGYASYGKVRFHSTATIAFLAAREISNLISQGTPIRAIKRLLFAETTQKIPVIKPTLRPVAAWLALDFPFIFDEIIKREPAVLLHEGDPGSFTTEQKKRLVRAYVAKPDFGITQASWVPRKQILRFATPELLQDAESCWADEVIEGKSRYFLLSIMEANPQKTTGDLAYSILINDKTKVYERRQALRILIKLNDNRLDSIVGSIFEGTNNWPISFTAYSITQLYPNWINSQTLKHILLNVDFSSEDDELASYWPEIINKDDWTIGALEELRQVLTDIIEKGSFWSTKNYSLSTKQKSLIFPLAAVCNRLLSMAPINHALLQSSNLAFRLFDREHSHSSTKNAISARTNSLPAKHRERLFWTDAELASKYFPHAKDNSWRTLYEVNRGLTILNIKQDKDWVIRELSKAENEISKRELLLSAAINNLWDGTTDRHGYVSSLKVHVADNEVLSQSVDDILKPTPESEQMRALDEENRKRTELHKQKERENIDSWKAFWQEIIGKPDRVFSEKHEKDTAWTLWNAMRSSRDSRQNSGWNRDFIEKYFNVDVANQLRSTLSRLWREQAPSLPGEGTKSDKILLIWEVGLAGIAAESEDPNWARHLSDEEVKSALRYVPIELNGFPSWLEDLVSVHPNIVKEVLSRSLRGELDSQLSSQSYAFYLQSISYSSKQVATLFIDTLLEWLEEYSNRPSQAAEIDVLKARMCRVINILLKNGSDSALDKLSVFAKLGCDELDSNNYLSVWLPTLIQLEPGTGIDRLEALLKQFPTTQHGEALTWFNLLFKDYPDAHSIELDASQFSPKILIRLVRLAYTYIRPEHDVYRNGVFTPDERDNAETVRGRLSNLLLKSNGPEAWEAKIAFAEDPLASRYRSNLLLAARESEAENIDQSVLTELDVNQIFTCGEAPAATSSDMFQLMHDRLEDIEECLVSDTSPRAAWANIKIEKEMRQVIANELRHQSRELYTVDQESVTGDEDETDIRLRNPMHQAIIELKIGENQSGKDLRNTVKEQLVKKYMTPIDCRAGCLLVTVNGSKGWQHPDTSEPLNVDELREMLSLEAEKIVEEMNFQLQISVFVLDLRSRK